MSVAAQFRQSAYYSAFYVGQTLPVQFALFDFRAGRKRPHDLTVYDSLHLLVYDLDGSSSARLDVPLSVMSSTADKITDIDGTTLVVARCDGNVVMTGSAGTVRAKIVGKIGSAYTLLDKPWLAEVFLGGPNT